MPEAEIVKSTCRMCHGGCGVLVHISEGKIVKVEGDPESPISKGRLCVKGRAALDLLYHPNRLKYPMKRVGERGEGKWQRISWDEALDIIASELSRIKKEYGAESIAIFQGTGRHHYHFVVRFANALGTPNWTEPGLAQCFFPRLTTAYLTFGEYLVNDYYGGVYPKCIIVWGHNPIVSGPDGELPWPFLDAINSGTKLIVIDPRRSETARRADIWLQIRPGTDCALALAMINTIIDEGLYDRDFVDKWVYGFDKLAEHVKPFTPEWAEEITWIGADLIREAAREFAVNKPAGIEWGVALEHIPNSIQTYRAVMILPAITGNIDIPGGLTFGTRVWSAIPILDHLVPDEVKRKRLGYDEYKLLSSEHSILPSAHPPTLFKAMRTGRPYPIKALLMFGNNPLIGFANSREVYESLKNLEFIAAVDLFMTPSIELLADVVLPAASYLEVDAIVGIPYDADRLVTAQKKLVRIGECKQDEEILIELSRKLNLKGNTEPLEEIYNQQLSAVGLTWEKLKEIGHVWLPKSYKTYEKNGFKTPTGKVEVYSTILEKLGYDPLPVYREPPESPISTPELAKKYPLILITGGRVPQFFHSEYRQIKPLRKSHPDPLVQIHPETAKERGIKDGDWVWIETARGRIKQKAKVTEDIHPRVVHCEHHWWFPEKGGPDYGVWESNVNILTNNNPPYDPAMGTYQLRAMLCDVYK